MLHAHRHMSRTQARGHWLFVAAVAAMILMSTYVSIIDYRTHVAHVDVPATHAPDTIARDAAVIAR